MSTEEERLDDLVIDVRDLVDKIKEIKRLCLEDCSCPSSCEGAGVLSGLILDVLYAPINRNP